VEILPKARIAESRKGCGIPIFVYSNSKFKAASEDLNSDKPATAPLRTTSFQPALSSNTDFSSLITLSSWGLSSKCAAAIAPTVLQAAAST
jgi:hypothetical protein